MATLRAKIAQLRAELERQKAKTMDLWRVNCEQLAEMDGSLVVHNTIAVGLGCGVQLLIILYSCRVFFNSSAIFDETR